eukprot:6097419-Amphidinium_carterae.2
MTDDQVQEDTTKANERANESQKEHTTTVTHNNKTKGKGTKGKDQPTSIWTLPNDTMNKQTRQQRPPHHSSSSTATTQLQTTAPRLESLDQMQLYETGSLQTTVNSVNATLTMDHKFTDYRQVQQWAILMDTGAMPSVAPSDNFPHIPLKQLRAEDPKPLTAVNGEQSPYTESSNSRWSTLTLQQLGNSNCIHHF